MGIAYRFASRFSTKVRDALVGQLPNGEPSKQGTARLLTHMLPSPTSAYEVNYDGKSDAQIEAEVEAAADEARDVATKAMRAADKARSQGE